MRFSVDVMKRQPLVFGILLVASTALASWTAADGLVGSEAAEAVQATLDVERTLLEEDLARHERIARQRDASSERLDQLYTSLEAAVRSRDAASLLSLEALLADIDGAERERAKHLAAERLVVERIRDRRRRIQLFEDRLDELQARSREETGPLEGRWAVALQPTNQRGVFVLSQSGTLVSGTYELEGGWTGSLQGTLVGRKVHLVRIDSKLGRSAELEGFLSRDGSRIRGTWQNYDLSGDSASSGQWSASRPAGP